MLTVTTTQSQNDLEQILALQQRYLIRKLTTDEWRDQGFLTVEHTPEVLKRMHDAAPSIIIKDGDRVVAYALTMLRECASIIPALIPMFENFNSLEWKGKSLNDHTLYVMGQICVDKDYRGQGLFDMLYHHHREVYSPEFDLLVTEIATRNSRSMRAHERVGFETIHVYRDELDEWAVVVWDWK
jgi:GNAT superfamily N-acetyltransferase